MKVQLLGIKPMCFADRETGEMINMTKLHVVSPYKENTDEMKGQRCDAIGTQLDCAKLELGKTYDLVYERPLGSSANARARLVDIRPV